ncbi:hypothetical protein SEPCBS119000_001836 [Sporothrix epigloea]|uniref:Glycosyl transferase CAP10 domain-containing protein n=1 Tax=Sporothrix epigloea TaxID=1892477 RepID=A0ABP0DG48_9PEZI
MSPRWVASAFYHFYPHVFILAAVYLLMLVFQPSFTPPALQFGSSWVNGHKAAREHPIEQLMKDAEHAFQETVTENPDTLSAAAHTYRNRRGRHPPPGFDTWYETARTANALIPESFFDRIYDDLEPLWGMEPGLLRYQAYSFPHVIRVRNGKVFYFSDPEDKTNWIELWADSLQEIAEFLPDIDIPVNTMEYPRLAVSWEEVQEMLAKGRRGDRGLGAPFDVITSYTGLKDLPPISPRELTMEQRYTHNWIDTKSTDNLASDAKLYWLHYRKTCPPDTPGRDANIFNMPERILYPQTPNTNYTRDGYVFDAKAARDPCVQPLMRAMHGTFVEPVGLSTSGSMMPLFAGSKLPGNNEILWPGAAYYARNKDTIAKDVRRTDWSSKDNKMFWQGPATGGINREMTWWRLHRHRFAQMTNGTTVDASVNFYKVDSPSFDLPLMVDFGRLYPEVLQHHPDTFKNWLKSVTNVSVTDLVCTPEQMDHSGHRLLTCPHSDRLISVQKAVPLMRWYDAKIVADIDSNTYSPYFASIVGSTSMPIKATMYAEWHDDRLFPWLHYVPMDNSFMDVYGILDYFCKDDKDSWVDHDDAAKHIAHAGAEWSSRVLRDDDMQLYTWRLLLEYARVSDPLRHKLGFVDDLVDRGKKHQNQ